MRLRRLEDWWLRFEPAYFCCADDDDDGGDDGDDGGTDGTGDTGQTSDDQTDNTNTKDDNTASDMEAGGQSNADLGFGGKDDGPPASASDKSANDSPGGGGGGGGGGDTGGDTGGGAFGGDARDTGRYDGGDGGGLAAGTDPGAGNVGNEQAGLDNASLGFGNDQTDGQGAAAAGDQAPGAQAGGQFGADARDIAHYGGTSDADVAAMKAGLGSNVGGEFGQGDIQTALTGSPNVAAALSQAGTDPTLASLDQTNPAWSGYNVTGTLGIDIPHDQAPVGTAPATPGAPATGIDPSTGFPIGIDPSTGQPYAPGAAPAAPANPLGPGVQNSTWGDTIAGLLGISPANAANTFDDNEIIMSNKPPGPQTVDSTTPGVLSNAPVGLGGPFQAGPTMAGYQQTGQPGDLPAWTDMTALSPNVNSPNNSVAAAINEGLAVAPSFSLAGAPSMDPAALAQKLADQTAQNPAPLQGGAPPSTADPTGLLSGQPMAGAGIQASNNLPGAGIPSTGLVSTFNNDPSQTVVTKTQPAASQATSSFQEQADTLAPWAFAGTPTGPAQPAPAPSPAPAPDNQIPAQDQPQPAPPTVSPPDTGQPTTQGPTAPTEPGGLTPDVSAALNEASPGGSTAPVGPPPLTAADLTQPIPVISQPDTPIPPADGGLPPFTPPPTESDGPNFNPESGLFGFPGMPGGAANQVINQSLPGGVQGPVLGPIMDPNGAGPPQPDGVNQNANEGLYSVLNNAIDTGDGANINPNQGIS